MIVRTSAAKENDQHQQHAKAGQQNEQSDPYNGNAHIEQNRQVMLLIDESINARARPNPIIIEASQRP